MSEQELDPQIVVAVQQAALDARDPNLRNRLNAAAAYFAALSRRDEREREAWAIVRDVAAQDIACADCGMGNSQVMHTPDCPVTRARRLLGGGEDEGTQSGRGV